MSIAAIRSIHADCGQRLHVAIVEVPNSDSFQPREEKTEFSTTSRLHPPHAVRTIGVNT
jgi:hypothetical protein